MLFNSFEFILFFIYTTILYFFLPHKYRWLLLLVASCYFYMAFVPIYIIILFGTIIIDYFAGILIENASERNRKGFLLLSIIANIGVLAVFKYYNFFIDNFNAALHLFSFKFNLYYLKILLPIGLSFHTFQAMSYTIEVYRGNQKAERHFGIYALYVMFYPQLVAGPIERPQNMLHQFYEKHDFNIHNCIEGLKKMLWGFFKKVVISDRLALVVDNVYNAPHGKNGLEIIIVVIFFSFQIYCDFSGYSDIAIGAAEVLGFKLMTNFNFPFKSRSMTEFWRRWHISLSTWFNDYLFTPLSTGLRIWSKTGIALSLMITFLLSGFWHGAGWKFIFYGFLHGIALVYEYLTRKSRKKLFNSIPIAVNNTISILCTYIYLIISWVFFRAASFADAIYLIKNIFGGWTKLSIKGSILELGGNDLIYGIFNLLLGSVLIFFLLSIEHKAVLIHPINIFNKKPTLLKWSFYFLLIISIYILGVYENKEFIYFQF